MTILIKDETREQANKLAERLGVHIPGNIDLVFWSLPLLQKLAEKLEKLEKKIES